MWSVPDKRLEEETMMRVWEQNNYLPSPIPWFQSRVDFRCCNLTCHQTGIWLWEHPLWKHSISGSRKFFYWHAIYKHGWLYFVDAASRCWTIYPAEKLFCFLNGAVAKNRTLAKPSCQVRRLWKLKSACLIYLYSFVCSMARRVPSFIEGWLCYAHAHGGCTFIGMAF